MLADKYDSRLSCYKYGKRVESQSRGHTGGKSCIISTEVCCGTGQFSFLSPMGGKYIKIPLGVRNHQEGFF